MVARGRGNGVARGRQVGFKLSDPEWERLWADPLVAIVGRSAYLRMALLEFLSRREREAEHGSQPHHPA